MMDILTSDKQCSLKAEHQVRIRYDSVIYLYPKNMPCGSICYFSVFFLMLTSRFQASICEIQQILLLLIPDIYYSYIVLNTVSSTFSIL